MKKLLVVLFAAVLSSTLSSPARVRMPRPEPIERRHFTLYLDNPHLAGRSDSTLTEVRRRLARLLGRELGYRPEVYVTESEQYFDYLVGGRFPDWGAAAAIPVRHMMVLKSPDHFNVQKPLEQLLAHELSHLALADRLNGHRAPRWFDEGLAMMVSTEWSWNDNLTMGRAAVFSSFVKLSEIEGLNRLGQSRAHQAYAQSYLAVSYLYDEYGTEQVAAFLDSLAAGAGYDRALSAATGTATAGFETELFEHFRKRYNITTLFMDTLFFWLGLAIIVIVAFIIKYNKRRAYYKKWEEEEKYQSTDFDYGDPDNPEQIDDDEPWRS